MSQGSEKRLMPLCSAERYADRAAEGVAVNGSSEVGTGNLKLSGPAQCLSVPGDSEFNLVSLSSWKGFSQAQIAGSQLCRDLAEPGRALVSCLPCCALF